MIQRSKVRFAKMGVGGAIRKLYSCVSKMGVSGDIRHSTVVSP